ncbi:MAG TPA: ABC transporter ATP-binding protein [bacterium]|nr:ABC transporter ATP-binding protein [bacterium]
MTAHIEVERLSKTYRHPMKVWKVIEAVKELSFTTDPGEIVGFVGHNGAGKTTTIKMLMGFVRPTAGRISLFGKAPGDPAGLRRLGFLPERPYFYSHLTGRELLRYFCGLSDIPGAAAKGRIENTLRMVGLSDAADLTLNNYSKGMLQRIGIAQAVIHDPELVVMDEPMSGLDPIGRREVKDIIRELKKNGKAVLFSSHILADIEDLSDRILIIENGVRRSFGPLTDIIPKQDISWHVSFAAPDRDRETLFAAFKGLRATSGHFTVTIATEQEMNATIATVLDKRYTIIEAGPIYPTLEEVVFRMKERSETEVHHG